jgi:ketosteroid isomerase-like protein
MRWFILIMAVGLALTLIGQQKRDDRTMNDKEQIIALYHQMYQAMVEKDTATLNRIHAPEFVLVHMTGMRQSKQAYIQAIADGTLNYYSAEHEQMDLTINNEHATLQGRSRVSAAVFGGGRHTWPLQLTFQLVKRNGHWLFAESRASTY